MELLGCPGEVPEELPEGGLEGAVGPDFWPDAGPAIIRVSNPATK
jgi:hypothetical protein